MQKKQSCIRNAERPSWNVGAKCILSKIPFATPKAYLCSPPPPVSPPPLPSICLQGEETFCHECRLWTTSQSLAIELHSAAKQISANSHSGISHGCVRSSKHPADPTQTFLTANSPLLLFFPCLKHDKKQEYSKPRKGELKATLDIYRHLRSVLWEYSADMKRCMRCCKSSNKMLVCFLSATVLLAKIKHLFLLTAATGLYSFLSDSNKISLITF